MENKDSERIRGDHIEEVRLAGRDAAARLGLQPADIESYSLDFEVYMLKQSRWAAWTRSGYAPAFLIKCAAHFAVDRAVEIETGRHREFGGRAADIEIAEQQDDRVDPQRDALQGDIRHELDAGIAELPPAQRTAVSLQYYMGMTSSEIAAILHISTKAAGMRLTRAHHTLRSTLEERDFNPNEAQQFFAAGSSPSQAKPRHHDG